MTVSQIVEQIASGLVSGLTTFAQGLGTGISNVVSSMMFTGTGESQTLSPYFIAVIAFGAVALAVGLTTLIFNWLTSLGGSR